MSKDNLKSDIKYDPLYTSDNHYYDVNFFEYLPKKIRLDALPSSIIFSNAISFLVKDSSLIDFANLIRKKNGTNKTLWGVRKEAEKYSSELYFYYPKKYNKHRLSNIINLASNFYAKPSNIAHVEDEMEYYLTSINIDDGRLTDVNIYLSLLGNEEELFYFEDKGLVINRSNPHFSSYSILSASDTPKKMNTYWGYFDGNILHRILGRIYELATSKFPEESPLKAFDIFEYVCQYCKVEIFHDGLVAEKTDALGLYFLHLDIDSFLGFLNTHDYDEGFINYLTKNKSRFSHLQFDVGLDFFLEAGKLHIKKTAFWGSF